MIGQQKFTTQQAIESFYCNKPTPLRIYLMVLRDVMLDFSTHITEEWKYRTIYFYLYGKPFCYVAWQEKQDCLYLGFARGHKMDHEALVVGNRTVVKVFPLDYKTDFPVEKLSEVLQLAGALYK